MVVFGVLGLVVCVAMTWTGVRLVRAGRQLEVTPTAEQGSVAAQVDRRLLAARTRVETLVMPEVEASELRPSAGAYEQRSRTYSVVGLGLLGLAAVFALGVLLLL
ncbi:hypothetical protein [Nocardioides flavescens]|uniref:Uncharacterized protein n=1 Tax=Nocardioides flavescens TaxID=2691959 RepID=A0A6L7F3S8_9ACTN|nr:hypothetical protein [Nocardioides flavescens]MXG91866.1 hypothetical protein [Nocardioides flavescens]